VNTSPDAGRLVRLERFSDLTDDEVALIASRGTQVHLPANWSLIWEKTPADKAYIILRGEVSVRRRGSEIARLGPGDTVGESAIVAHRLRNASVVSLTELDVLHFTSEAVRQLLGEVPSFRTALEETTRERLGSTAS
jgi:CRP-like cAMP-binding protein